LDFFCCLQSKKLKLHLIPRGPIEGPLTPTVTILVWWKGRFRGALHCGSLELLGTILPWLWRVSGLASIGSPWCWATLGFGQSKQMFPVLRSTIFRFVVPFFEEFSDLWFLFLRNFQIRGLFFWGIFKFVVNFFLRNFQVRGFLFLRNFQIRGSYFEGVPNVKIWNVKMYCFCFYSILLCLNRLAFLDVEINAVWLGLFPVANITGCTKYNLISILINYWLINFIGHK